MSHFPVTRHIRSQRRVSLTNVGVNRHFDGVSSRHTLCLQHVPIAIKVLTCFNQVWKSRHIRGDTMKPRIATLVLSELIFLCSIAPQISCSPLDDQWNSLRQITNRTDYIFVNYGRDCIRGKIKQVNQSDIVVAREDGSQTVIRKPDLLRITLGAWQPGLIFTARSSWFDVHQLVGRHFRPEIAVTMKSGQKHKGRLLSASDASVELRTSGATLNIAKVDVSAITYIRSKPLSSSASYADAELAWMKVFDPELWPHLFRLQSPLSIVVYDASAPQDDSRIVCNQDPLTGGKQARDLTAAPY